jgi:predicted DNA-binding protein with PD1-like motif
MLYGNSTVARRVVGRLNVDDALPDSLVDLCREANIRAGWLRGQGILDRVELAQFKPEKGEFVTTFRSDEAVELLSLSGNVSTMGPELVINAYALVAYAAHGQNHVVGGQLKRARAHAVEFVIDVFEDLDLQRGLDPVTGLPLWKSIVERPGVKAREASAPAKPATAPPSDRPVQSERAPSEAHPPSRVFSGRDSGRTRAADRPPRSAAADKPPVRPQAARETEPASADAWRQAAKRSEELVRRSRTRLETADFELDDVELEKGDILLHPKLGECTVVRVEDDQAAYIRLPGSRRVSKLALTVVRLERVEDRADGKRVYKVTAGRR